MKPMKTPGRLGATWPGMVHPGALADTASFDPIRCANDLVAVGDSQHEVLQEYGEPAHNEASRGAYDSGSANLPRVVVFERQRVVYFESRARP